MRKLITMAFATIFAFTSIAAAANQPNASVEVGAKPGSGLTASIGAADFGRIDHSLDSQTIQGKSLVVNISDTRGTGEGWSVTIAGTDFKRQDGKSFGIDNLSLQTPQVTTLKGQEYTKHAFQVNGVPMVQSNGQNSKIASAQSNTGIGEYKLTHPATLTVPGGTLIGSYKSTLTVSIVSGP